MDDEIELISDGDGLAVVGAQGAVERFLDSLGLLSLSQLLPLDRLGSALNTFNVVAQAGSEVAAKSGRWVKLTEESAQAIKKFGLTESRTPGVSHAMAGKPGQIKQWLQIETGPGTVLADPAMLAGAAGIMAQLARQHEIAEIKAYLAELDGKVDEILRNQDYAEWSRMAGAGSVIRDALIMRDTKGRVDAITWSKVQRTPETIAAAQDYALLRLGDIAEGLESARTVGDAAKKAKAAEAAARDLLAVVANCLELQDAVDVLELDRVLDESPGELDPHRVGLATARQERRGLIVANAKELMGRLDAAAGATDSRKVLHAPGARAVVDAINRVGLAIDQFATALGVAFDRDQLEGTRWVDAIQDRRQMQNAAAEAVPVAVVGVAVAALGALALGASKKGDDEA